MVNLQDAKALKQNLKKCIENQEISEASSLLKQYNDIVDYDIEVKNISAILDFLVQDLKKAEKKLLNLFYKFEFNFDVNFNLGIVYMNIGEYEKAVNYFIRCMCIDSSRIELAISEINIIVNENMISADKLNEIKTANLSAFSNYHKVFPKSKEGQNYVGKLFNIKDKNYATGIYDHYFAERDGLLGEYSEGTRNMYKLELIPSSKTSLFSIELKNKSVIPFMVRNSGTKLQLIINEKEYILNEILPNRFYYYAFNAGDDIKFNSDKEFIIGEVIESVVDISRPRLILNIFVDGLSQKFIEDNGLEKVMPNAYNFFKEGTVCENTYVSGEWTYVSLASFFTGMYTTNHKVYHPDYSTFSLYDKELFTEIFHKEGYFTAKIDGDWRSTPSAGYMKGIDRYLYQPSVRGMHTDDVINETIEHLEAFKEKNNFVWVSLPDLHDVADEFEARISSQVNNPIETRVFKKSSATSVRKAYDEKKIYKYGTQLKRIDTYLGLLFSYIEDNYKDDDYIVSLIADHGQGYFVQPDRFLDEGRTKVAMMFRGRNIPKGECKEMIQGLDLFPIIMNSLNINNIDLKDGNIPKYFGGENKREFTYTETIFPNSPYRAVINDLEHKFFFDTKENCQVDGRFNIEGYTFKLINKNKEEDETEKFKEKADKYLKVVFEHIKEYIII